LNAPVEIGGWTARALAGLVRDDGYVHRAVYYDPEIYALEKERLFSRVWHYIGHESQLREAGDYVTAKVVDEPVVAIRDKDGAIHGLVNRCTHRGAILCSFPAGQARRLTCPYHGWTFTHDGRLAGIPLEEDYPADFDRAAHALKPVGGLAVHRGFVFVRLSQTGASLEEYFGPSLSNFDALADRSPTGQVELACPPIKHRYRGNWKLMMENLNDSLHTFFAHASSLQAAQFIFKRDGVRTKDATYSGLARIPPDMGVLRKFKLRTLPNGHSTIEGFFGDALGAVPEPDKSNYIAAMEQFWGRDKAQAAIADTRHVCLMYPSMCVQPRFQSVRTVTPLAVDDTEVAFYAFRLPGAPERVLEEALHYANSAGSAHSPIVTDDLEIYERMQTAYASGANDWVTVRRCQRKLYEGQSDPNLHPGTTERYILNQFRAWRGHLAAA
jgi:phenylpropionate dioxygenase-like ring-hydroxylating dioxygenase large terminal subunit